MPPIRKMGHQDKVCRQPAENTAKTDEQQKPRKLALFKNDCLLHFCSPFSE
jgi:hypothetical protein